MKKSIFILGLGLLLFASCSCQYHARKAENCITDFQDTVKIPVEFEVITHKVCIDTFAQIVNDTFITYIDSIKVVGVINYNAYGTPEWVSIKANRPEKTETIRGEIPVPVPELAASWKNWLSMTIQVWGNSVKGWFGLFFVIVLCAIIVKFLNRRK